MDKRFLKVDERFRDIDKRLHDMDKRLHDTDKCFHDTEAKKDATMEVSLKEMASRIEKGYNRIIQWVVGIFIFSIVLYFAVVIGISYKVNPNIFLNPVSVPWNL